MQLAPTTVEQRADIYKDARLFLRPGFIAHSVEINGSHFVLRSLDERDWDLLQYRAGTGSLFEWKRWTVAASIWMVSGQIVSGDEGLLYRMYEMCRALPMGVLEDLYQVLNALMRRMRDATEVMAGFLYEDESRYMWMSEGEDLVRDATGVLRAGLNPIQKLWVYFNRSEDKSAAETSDWNIAKFIVGPHAPKGIKKIQSKDKQQEADLTRRRQQAMDRCYYEAKGMIPKQGEAVSKKEYGDWDVAIAETPEELKEQMRRWVEGIKDPHDDVIDFVKSKIKTEKETAKARIKTQREALSRAVEEEGLVKSHLVPLTGKAAGEFIERVKKRMPGVSKVLQDETHNSAYEKYIKNNPEVGILKVDDEGKVTSSVDVTEDMLEMLRKPEEGETRSLQEELEGRRPTMEGLGADPEGGDS